MREMVRAARRGRCDRPRCHERAEFRQAVRIGFAGGGMKVWVKRCEQHKVHEFDGYDEMEAA